MVIKMSVYKNVLKNFQMSEQYWGCLDKISEVNFSRAETLVVETFFQCHDSFHMNSALDKLLGQLCIYATWLSSIAYLQKQLRIFIFFMPRFFSVITHFLIA